MSEVELPVVLPDCPNCGQELEDAGSTGTLDIYRFSCDACGARGTFELSILSVDVENVPEADA